MVLNMKTLYVEVQSNQWMHGRTPMNSPIIPVKGCNYTFFPSSLYEVKDEEVHCDIINEHNQQQKQNN
ncbi:transcription factor IIE subunit 2 [Acrasis kona]|uniref:Transcription factor IIE subunit 2 n=1 Tax=Acrasis kona TaxID=1008807 RepID=A0AAW2YYV3_9EUKA